MMAGAMRAAREKGWLGRAFAALLACVLLAAGLCGCSGGEGDADADADAGSQSSIAVEVADEDDGSDDADVEAEAEADADASPADGATLTVHFLDVGQGDSTFIELPDGETMLIDAGTEDYGDEVVAYIEALGYERIDYVVATHPHDDHIGGLAEVLESFEVGQLWAPDAESDTWSYEDFVEEAEEEDLKIHEACAGEEIVDEADEDLSVEVLGPEEGLESEDLNDYSVVLYIEYEEISFLFTGDAAEEDLEDEVEELDAEEGGDADVDVLKVAHHGSDTGTDETLAEELSCEVAVISYEEGNSYGHPDQSVLDALEDAGAEVYGTGANGTVVVESDGEELVQVEVEVSGEVEAGVYTGDDADGDGDADASAADDLDEDDTVYVTATGSKYHSSEDCWGLRNANSVTAVTLEEAEERGLEPCGVCW